MVNIAKSHKLVHKRFYLLCAGLQPMHNLILEDRKQDDDHNYKDQDNPVIPYCGGQIVASTQKVKGRLTRTRFLAPVEPAQDLRA